jgi:predicted RNA-binding Zn-ribbon protein involved in translation (DUF1610 family)
VGERVNIKAKHLKCPICGKAMDRCEDNSDNWYCEDCNVAFFIRMVG